jgi:hypothetical protein
VQNRPPRPSFCRDEASRHAKGERPADQLVGAGDAGIPHGRDDGALRQGLAAQHPEHILERLIGLGIVARATDEH